MELASSEPEDFFSSPTSSSTSVNAVINEQDAAEAKRRAATNKLRLALSQQIPSVIDALNDDIHQGSHQTFLRQKEIEVEWKATLVAAEAFHKQIKQWLELFHGLMNAFKELGSMTTWVEAMEREMHVISWTTEQEYQHQVKSTTPSQP